MILALDISLNTGYALLGPEGKITFGTRIFQAYNGPGFEIMAGRKFRDWLEIFLDKHRPTELVLERPFFRGDCTWLLVGLAWEAQRAAELRSIPFCDYQPGSIKKTFTGNWRAKKPEMVTEARKLGYSVSNDHEADAIALIYHHMKTKGKPLDRRPGLLV